MTEPDATQPDPTEPDATEPIRLLVRGELTIKGRMPWSSNGTYLAEAAYGGEATDSVYKPHNGERPLWDFPSGLFNREVAAYELSEALGWDLVPPTVLRTEGPMGEGSLQLFVDADFSQHYFTLYEDEQYHDQLRAMCAFDLLANNTDRKSGHCLLDPHGHIYGIDNGLSFHHEFKLRTVIWEFGGEPVPDPLLTDIHRLIDEGLTPPLVGLLDPFERDAVLTRARALARDGCFPIDHSGRRYPWPLV